MSEPHPLEIPGHVTFADGGGGLRKVLVETAWSTAEIYPHGAHITAFRKKGEAPLLFLSAASEFHPKKPIRGGVPIIFPWFGPREALPAHGFARTVEWDLLETSVTAEGAVGLRLAMPATKFFEVSYVVTVGETLVMELQVTHTAMKDAMFETCLHSYFQIGDIHSISITGLKDTGYHDKVHDMKTLETHAAIRIDGEVDRVYSDTASTVEIHDPGLGRVIRVEKSGSNTTVVWNPWIDKSKRMADFGDEEYLQMVCVESGNVAKNQITLPPGGSAVMRVEVGSRPLV